MIKAEGNILYHNGMKVQIEYPILDAVVIKNKILIVYDNPDYSDCNNALCYSNKLKPLWRIKPVPPNMGGTERCSYVGISVQNDKVGVVDFFGRRFWINNETGDIISMDIVK